MLLTKVMKERNVRQTRQPSKLSKAHTNVKRHKRHTKIASKMKVIFNISFKIDF